MSEQFHGVLNLASSCEDSSVGTCDSSRTNNQFSIEKVAGESISLPHCTRAEPTPSSIALACSSNCCPAEALNSIFGANHGTAVQISGSIIDTTSEVCESMTSPSIDTVIVNSMPSPMTGTKGSAHITTMMSPETIERSFSSGALSQTPRSTSTPPTMSREPWLASAGVSRIKSKSPPEPDSARIIPAATGGSS